VRDQASVVADDQRVAGAADVDPVDHLPQLFELELAHHPGRAALRALHADRDRGRRQHVVVDLERRDVGAIGPVHRRLRYVEARAVDRTGRERPSGGVEDGNLAEFRKVEDVVLEDALLLPGLEAGGSELGPDRLQHPGVVAQVHADLLGHLAGNPQVAVTDRRPGPGAQRADRHVAVDHQREDRCRGNEQHEP